MTDEAGPDRVVQHIGNRRLQVLVRVDHPGREPTAEEVAAALVTVVEALRVLPVEVLDSRRKPRLSGVEDKMHVIAHQTEGVAVPAVALDGLGEQREIGDSVVVVPKDGGAVHAPRSDVEVPVRELRPKNARHRHRAYELTGGSEGDRARPARSRHAFPVLRGQ
jgi:hypothetical protein